MNASPSLTRDAVSLVLLNARIWTGDAGSPEAEALAIAGNRIAAVGSNAEISPLAASACPRIDLTGRRVLPGFNDAHVHFYMAGAGLAGVQLRSARSAEEFRARLADYARTIPEGEWILGGFWDHEAWDSPQLPTRALVDDVTARHPVYVRGMAGHMSFANTLALRRAGAEDMPDVADGVVVRDSRGRPTGVLKEAAQALVEGAVPIPSLRQVRTAILAAQRHALAYGVTSVQDMGVVGAQRRDLTARILRAYRELLREGELRMRISFHVPLPEIERYLGSSDLTSPEELKFRVQAVKSFSDGGLGSSTAWFFDEYRQMPGWHGLPSEEMADPETMYAHLRRADRAGLRLAVHAIGDRANHEVLNMFTRLQKEEGRRDRRWRIEHAQHLRPQDIPRFAELDVIASVQPFHCIDDARWADNRISPEQANGTYAFRSLLDHGARLALGSDWFVAPLDPMTGIYAAATRRVVGGTAAWHPEQIVSVEEAVRGYTSGAAYASGDEAAKGTLAPGRLADLTVISRDILAIDPAEIIKARVELTICDGQIVHDARCSGGDSAQRSIPPQAR